MNMYRANLAKRILSAVLAATMAVSLFYASSTVETQRIQAEKALAKQQEEDLTEAIETVAASDDEEKGTSDKEETVYVMTDGDGNTEKIIVSDHLSNLDKASSIEDATDLTDIENTKGDEEYKEGAGDSITWEAAGSEIYYQGKSTKDLPVGVNISYELNGREVTADELAGQSGTVKIRFDYTNNEKKTVKIAGKSEEICVPFTMVSGMVLDNDRFSDIQVTNGKVISEGDSSIVVGYAFPGLQESLGIGDKLLEEHADEVDIPEYVEITAEVENFKLGMTMTAAMNDLLSDVDLDKIDTEEMDDSIDQLDSATSELLKGTISLQDGSNELAKAMSSAKSGSKQLASGVAAIVDGINTKLPNALNNTISQYTKAANGVDKASQNLTAQISTMVTDAAAASAAAASEAAEPVVTAAVTAGVKSAMEGTSAAYESAIQNVVSGMQEQLGKLSEVKGAAQSASSYAATASELIAEAMSVEDKDQRNALLQKAQQAADGAKQYADGIGSSIPDVDLSKISVSADQATIDKISGTAAKAATGAAEEAKGKVDQSKITKAASDAAAKDMNSVKSAATTLANDAGAKGAVTALEGVKSQIASSFTKKDLNALKEGANELADGTVQLESGAKQLADGAKQLKDGMNQFDEEGIQELVSLYEDDVKGLMDRFEAVQDAGKSYQTFTRLAKGSSGNVKFIFKSGEISATDED